MVTIRQLGKRLKNVSRCAQTATELSTTRNATKRKGYLKRRKRNLIPTRRYQFMRHDGMKVHEISIKNHAKRFSKYTKTYISKKDKPV